MKKYFAILAAVLIASGSAAYAKADHGGGNGKGLGLGLLNQSQSKGHDGDNDDNFEFNVNAAAQALNQNATVKVNFRISPVMQVQVVSVSGSKISAKNVNGLNVSIDTTGASIMPRSGNKTIALTDIQAGDVLSVTGSASSDGSSFAARMIRNLSLKRAKVAQGNFSGTVVSVGANGTGTFVVGNQIITTNSATVFTKNGAAAVFADLAAGQSVKGTGSFDANHVTFTANTVNITTSTTPAPTTQNVSFTGTLTVAPSGNTLTVLSAGTTFTVDASTATITRTGVTGNVLISTLHSGDTVQVTGTEVSGTNNVTATAVTDQTAI